MKARTDDIIILLARVLLSSIALVSGLISANNFGGYINAIEGLGIPFPLLTSVLSVAINILVGIFIFSGLFTRVTAILFGIYILFSAFLGHPFWAFNGSEMIENEINFMRNVSITGGMLLLWIHGAGFYSLDRLIFKPGTEDIK